MKSILQEISALAIQINESLFTQEQKSLKWLGSNPASIDEIMSTESRLSIKFPDDYKNFLLITNGFLTPADATEPTFASVDKIDYLKNIDSFLLEVWCEDPLIKVGKELARSLVIAGINDEQYFLLIPPDSPYGQWRYWKFASWIPGEHEYKNLDDYFTSVLDFMKESL